MEEADFWEVHHIHESHGRVCCFGCLEGVSKSVQVLFNCKEAVTVLTLIILKWRALHGQDFFVGVSTRIICGPYERTIGPDTRSLDHGSLFQRPWYVEF